MIDAKHVSIPPVERGESPEAYCARLRAAGVPASVIADMLTAVNTPQTLRAPRGPQHPPAESPVDWDISE